MQAAEDQSGEHRKDSHYKEGIAEGQVRIAVEQGRIAFKQLQHDKAEGDTKTNGQLLVDCEQGVPATGVAVPWPSPGQQHHAERP